jgi:hypothetical protein
MNMARRNAEILVLIPMGFAFLFASPPRAAGQGAVGFPSAKFAPPAKPNPDTLSKEQLRNAQPLKSSDGALWAVKVPWSSRKSRLVGCPSRFVIEAAFLETPFQDRILARDFATGSFGISPPPLGGLVDQITYSRGGMAVIFKSPERLQPTEDFLFMGSWAKHPSRLLTAACTPWRVLVSPDLTVPRLVTCADDESMRLWDTSTGKEIARFPGYGIGGNFSDRRGDFVAFSSDGRWLATAFGTTVSFRRPSDGAEMLGWSLAKYFHPLGWISAIRFSPGDKSLMAFPPPPLEDDKEKKPRFFQWDLGLLHETVFEGTRPAVDGKFTVDGKRLVTCNISGELSVWHVEIAQETHVINAAPTRVYDLTFSPTGEILATAGNDDKVRFWSSTDWRELATDKEFHHRDIDYVRFNDDGRYLITASEDGLVQVWDAPEFARARTGFNVINRGLDTY